MQGLAPSTFQSHCCRYLPQCTGLTTSCFTHHKTMDSCSYFRMSSPCCSWFYFSAVLCKLLCRKQYNSVYYPRSI